MSIKKIMVLKHFTAAYDVSTNKQMQNVCLSLLKERYVDENDMYPNTPPKEIHLGMTTEQINNLPNSLFKECGLRVLIGYEDACRVYKDELEFRKQAARTVKNLDGKLAVKLMERVRCLDDEGFFFVDILETKLHDAA